MNLPKTAFATTVVFLIYRLFFAVDFSDESAYITIPLQTAMGAIPFVDETSVLQLAGLLLVPIFKLYLLLFPSHEGIMLFARILFLAVWAGGAFYLVLSLRKSSKFPRGFSENALWLATLGWIPAIPVNLMGLSYNSLGVLFLLLGLWSGWRGRTEPLRFAWRLSLFLSLSCWCYPGYGVVLVPFCIVWWLTLPAPRWPLLKNMLLGVTPLLLLIILIIAFAGVPTFLNTLLGFNGQGEAFTPIRVWTLVKRLLPIVGLRSVLPCALFLAGISFFFQRRYPRHFSRYVAGLVAVGFAALISTRPYFGSIYFAYDLSVRAALSFPVLLLLRPMRDRYSIAMWVWLPCLPLGLISALSSTSGLSNVGLGLLPCLFLALLWLGEWLEIVTQKLPNDALKKISNVAFALVSLVALAKGTLFGTFFYDDKYALLTHQITKGPYRWLFTTPEKGRFLEGIATDLTEHIPDGAWITFYTFQGGLLHGSFRNAASSGWVIGTPEGLERSRLKILSRPRENHYFFLYKKLYYSSGYINLQKNNPSPDVMVELTKHGFSPILERENYTLLKRTPL